MQIESGHGRLLQDHLGAKLRQYVQVCHNLGADAYHLSVLEALEHIKGDQKLQGQIRDLGIKMNPGFLYDNCVNGSMRDWPVAHAVSLSNLLDQLIADHKSKMSSAAA